MSGDFLDSNVLLYLTSPNPAKASRAEQLIETRPTVSVQVLNEAANVARRKFGRTWREIADWLDRLTRWLEVRPLTEPVHRDALRLVERYRLAWWDALIIASALSADCSTLYSEDMHHGLVIDGRLTILNPFA